MQRRCGGLGALRLFGYRLWPGIFLGSLLINLPTALHAPTSGKLIDSVLMVIGIASGAALQAVVGTGLLRRWIEEPIRLITEKEVILFLLLGGPISCVVSATMGVTSLWIGDVIHGSDFLFNWWTWWVGDSIGVLIFGPLAINLSLKSQEEWRRTQLNVSVPLGVTFVLTVALFIYTNHWERNRIKRSFEQQTIYLSHLIAKTFDSCRDVLHSVGSYVTSSPAVDRVSVQKFVDLLLPRHPGLMSVSWHPVVTRTTRVEDHWGPATPDAISLARDHGDVMAIGRVDPGGASVNPIGFAIVMPVYRRGVHPTTVTERRKAFLGYTEAVLHIPQIMAVADNSVGQQRQANPFDIALYDELAAPPEALLYYRAAGMADDPEHGVTSREAEHEMELVKTHRFDVAGRPWELRFALSKRYLFSNRTWVAWGILAAGLLITGLLGAFLLILTGRTTLIAEVVAKRTVELEQTTRTLQQSREQLQESEARFRSVTQAANDAIISADDRGLIRLWNNSATRLFGYDETEVLGKLWTMLIPKRFIDVHQVGFDRYRVTGELRLLGKTIELMGMKKDQTEFPLELSLSSWTFAEANYFTAIIRDMTDRKRAEAERLKLAQVEESVRLRDEFLSIASHELRTPLAALQLKLQTAGRIVEADDGQRLLKDRIARALQQVNRLGRLIEGLLDVSRITAGRLQLTIEELELGELVRDVVERFHEEAAVNGSEIRLRLDRPAVGRWDRIRIEQVVINLLTNAMKYGNRKPIEITVKPTKEKIVLMVEDYGIGIPPDQTEKIFLRFERAVSSQNCNGLGLGLYISRQIMEAHGGRIWAESAGCVGSRFYVELPLAS